jgi:uncharacterized membrane-anchored protein YhcB (DUF1043 family)
MKLIGFILIIIGLYIGLLIYRMEKYEKKNK